jgi:hypothetical protein
MVISLVRSELNRFTHPLSGSSARVAHSDVIQFQTAETVSSKIEVEQKARKSSVLPVPPNQIARML